ncbi:hypothetical protein ACFQV4_13995 [Streptomyces thermocarboxydus]
MPDLLTGGRSCAGPSPPRRWAPSRSRAALLRQGRRRRQRAEGREERHQSVRRRRQLHGRGGHLRRRLRHRLRRLHQPGARRSGQGPQGQGRAGRRHRPQLQPRFVGGNPPDLIDNSGEDQIGFLGILDQLEELDDLFEANTYEGKKIADIVYPGVKAPARSGTSSSRSTT